MYKRQVLRRPHARAHAHTHTQTHINTNTNKFTQSIDLFTCLIISLLYPYTGNDGDNEYCLNDDRNVKTVYLLTYLLIQAKLSLLKIYFFLMVTNNLKILLTKKINIDLL